MAKPLIIFDTDMGTDCDDVAALVMLDNLCEAGEAELLACTHSTRMTYGVTCTEVINRMYLSRQVPIGVTGLHKKIDDDQYDNYADCIARQYFMSDKTVHNYPDAVDVMRAALANAPDGSVTFIGVGQSTNFGSLLQSGPDDVSPLSGLDLVAKKSKELVLMAGFFDYTNLEEFKQCLNVEQSEYNVFQDIGAAQYVMDFWPTPIVFSGFEIGHWIITGKKLAHHGKTHPLTIAYSHFGGQRYSWDQTAVLYAVRGLGGLWGVSRSGKVSVSDRGFTSFEPSEAGGHRYLVQKADPQEAADLIDELMARQPMCKVWQEAEVV